VNGYLVFEHLDKTAGDRLLELVGPDGPLRAAAVGVTGTPSAVAAYDAETIKDAQDRVDRVRGRGLSPLVSLAHVGDRQPGPSGRRAEIYPGQPVPLRVFGLAVRPGDTVAVTVLHVPPARLPAAVQAAADSNPDGTAVSPVTGGPWTLLVEHVDADLPALHAKVRRLHGELCGQDIPVSSAQTLYAPHDLFRTVAPPG
jgi:hypothetical protein